MLYLTITTLILFSTSSSFVAVLAAATSTTHRRNDDNDQEAPSSSFMPPQHSQLTSNNDPIRDGRLVYSDESVQDVIFDFRLAYPPYNRKSLDKLLLLPPKQKQQQQQQQTNGKMDTDLEEEDAVIVTMAEEMGMAASEDEVVNVNNNDYCDDNSLQNEKSTNNSTIMETNISHVSMEYDYEDTTTTNAHQDIDNAVESSVVEDDTTLVASPEFTNDDDDYDNNEENITINNDNVTLSSSSSPSLLESQQLEEDYLTTTTTTTTNADRITPPQREEEHEITQSNHIMKDNLLDSSINDNIHLDDTIIVHDDDMSSEITNANSHHQIIDGRSIHDRTSNVSLESLEASYNDLKARADDDTLSTMQDVVGRQDDSTISTTTIHSSSSTTTTSTISSLTTTTTASSTSNANANRQFVDGLDDLPKLFESVEVPDELDVGADGSSMQEVLVGQGIKILWKHVKNVRGGISSRLGWNKLGSAGDSVWRALPWSNYGSSGSEMEEQDNMSLLDSLLLSNHLTDDRAEKTTSESRWVKTKLESFSLVKSPTAKKIWNFAQRKIVQTRQLLDKIVQLFEGEEDEDDYYDETNESFLKSRL